MRIEGRLKQWNSDTGLGLLAPVQGGRDVVVSMAAFPPEARPAVGDWLSVASQHGQGGMIQVRRVERHWSAEADTFWGDLSIMSIALFAFALANLVFFDWLDWPWVAVYGFASSVLFVLYGQDKKAASSAQRRIAERTLHFWAVLGGWPGAVLAQQVYRHKLAKPAFMSIFRLTVLVNLCLLLVVLAAGKAEWLHTLLGLVAA